MTCAIILFLFNLLTEPFTGLVERLLAYTPINIQQGFLFLSSAQIVHFLSQILVLFTLISTTLTLGFLARLFFFHTLLKMGEYFLNRIPFVNKLYKTSQDIIKTLFGSSKKAFKQVVMVPYPSSHSYAIGLLAGSGDPECVQALQADMLSVFIPTTPNPTSGFLLLFKKEDVILLKMKVEDALKYIISCGAVTKNLDSN